MIPSREVGLIIPFLGRSLIGINKQKYVEIGYDGLIFTLPTIDLPVYLADIWAELVVPNRWPLARWARGTFEGGHGSQDHNNVDESQQPDADESRLYYAGYQCLGCKIGALLGTRTRMLISLGGTSHQQSRAVTTVT